MKNLFTRLLLASSLLALPASDALAQQEYVPTPENLQSLQAFSDMRFGIFLHWGL